jgi:hypothetical protein
MSHSLNPECTLGGGNASGKHLKLKVGKCSNIFSYTTFSESLIVMII